MIAAILAILAALAALFDGIDSALVNPNTEGATPSAAESAANEADVPVIFEEVKVPVADPGAVLPDANTEAADTPPKPPTQCRSPRRKPRRSRSPSPRWPSPKPTTRPT